ncbi:MAG TPA: hypothetical protein VHR97_00785 [Candidatus Baltobacteraceae bacterium]|jgi:hypothetical protein|nr:hypothetical protein [Candidatus Baltobacteraceae bacterium]
MIRFAPGMAALVLLAGCGAPPQGVVPGAVNDQNAVAGSASPDESWTAKGLKQRDLLYVTNADGTVSVFRYWQRSLVGVLTHFKRPWGACSDQSGDVYITDFTAAKVYEYAHGGTKAIKVLDDPGYSPEGCSVAPGSGDLAVGNGTDYYYYYTDGSLAIYPHGSGSPILYKTNDEDHFTSCAYDNHGDLLTVSRYGYYGLYTQFYYLPKQSSKLIPMNLPGPGQSSSGWDYVQGVAFDGKYFVVASYDRLYRFTINVKAQYVDTITLSGGYGSVAAPAIYRKSLKGEGTQVVGGASDDNKSAVDYWRYPAGGNAIDAITKDLDAPSGVAISLGKE